ncbi:hypothetical protein OCU04_003122 [Sclerotinia nivalis]|uniref:Uncharacterized protein n=1 Tax=Sclerotinia nivalis TaxID=352851 RepID=A0A9X0DQT4_9HELO|nr:hypothetical protein OCU04_003122 [Sclerotinia nivalis]
MNTPQSSRGGTRGRGRGRGHGNAHNNNRPPHSHTNHPSQEQVPRISLLHPGTPVSIVLKMDQGSGREVRGFVGELLTRGDHPRGVKVRLRDGRVGRVQRLCTEEEAVVGEGGRRGLGENEENGEGGEGGGMRAGMGEGVGGGGRGKGGPFPSKNYTDFRNDGYDESSAASNNAGASLEDYIVVKGNGNRKGKGKGKGKKGGRVEENLNKVNGNEEDIGGGEEKENGEELREERSTEEIFKSVLSICPVCEEFEGDEVAVAHHVNGHFE